MELGVELAVAASQHLELRHAGLIVGVQQQLGISRGRGVARHEGQAGLGRDDAVDPQGVIHQDAVGAALDGEPRSGV